MLIRSKEIASRYGLPYSTVTHYTNMGFFTVVSRSGNQRLYDEEEINSVVAELRRLIDEGYPLRLIRKQKNS